MTSEKDPQAADDAGARSWSYRLARVRPEERGPACLAAAAFFFLFASYAILRPLRDAAGTEGGVGDLKYLWTGTLVATLVLTPVFGWMVARFPRRVFVPAALHFFAANMLVFQMGFAWAGPDLEVHVARVFYVWVSVFNVFAVALFWSVMADRFSAEQAKRLFAFVSIGATAGGLVAARSAAFVAREIGDERLLVIAVLVIELALPFLARLQRGASAASTGAARAERDRPSERASDRPIGGSAWAGFTAVRASGYLRMIALYAAGYAAVQTALNYGLQTVVKDSMPERAERTAFFADLDSWIYAFQLALQLGPAAWIVGALGLVLTLVLLPAAAAAMFGALLVAPGLTTAAVAQVAFRSGQFGISKPARETLYTVVTREEKYKAKSFIDTFVHRAADQVSIWTFSWIAEPLKGYGLAWGVPGVAAAGLVCCLGWAAAGVAAGRGLERRAERPSTASAETAAESGRA